MQNRECFEQQPMAKLRVVWSQVHRAPAAPVAASEALIVQCPSRSQLLASLESVICVHYK